MTGIWGGFTTCFPEQSAQHNRKTAITENGRFRVLKTSSLSGGDARESELSQIPLET